MADLTYLISLTCGFYILPCFMQNIVRSVAAISLAIPYVSGVVTRSRAPQARGRGRGSATPLSVMKRKGVFIQKPGYPRNQHPISTIAGEEGGSRFSIFKFFDSLECHPYSPHLIGCDDCETGPGGPFLVFGEALCHSSATCSKTCCADLSTWASSSTSRL